jgi:hypothetical protein
VLWHGEDVGSGGAGPATMTSLRPIGQQLAQVGQPFTFVVELGRADLMPPRAVRPHRPAATSLSLTSGPAHPSKRPQPAVRHRRSVIHW